MNWLLAISAVIIVYLVYLVIKHSGDGCPGPHDHPMQNPPLTKKIVLYYRNGCPPCEKIKPTWKTLEEAFESDEHVHVIKVDTEDPASVIEDPIDGTPDIYLKYGSKSIQYTGDRSLESLISFIISN